MPYCIKCGQHLVDGARFCHSCGSPTPFSDMSRAVMVTPIPEEPKKANFSREQRTYTVQTEPGLRSQIVQQRVPAYAPPAAEDERRLTVEKNQENSPKDKIKRKKLMLFIIILLLLGIIEAEIWVAYSNGFLDPILQNDFRVGQVAAMTENVSAGLISSGETELYSKDGITIKAGSFETKKSEEPYLELMITNRSGEDLRFTEEEIRINGKDSGSKLFLEVLNGESSYERICFPFYDGSVQQELNIVLKLVATDMESGEIREKFPELCVDL